MPPNLWRIRARCYWEAHLKYVFAFFFAVSGLCLPEAKAMTLLGDTVQYEVRTPGSVVFGSGSAVVGDGVEFVVDAAADVGFSDGAIAVDVSGSSIVFRGPTTPNTFRYGYQTIRIFSLDFAPSAEIGGIVTTVSVVDPLDLAVTFGPSEVVLHLGNSLWVPGVGDTIRVDLVPVPEPATAALLLTGLLAIGGRAWRRRGR